MLKYYFAALWIPVALLLTGCGSDTNIAPFTGEVRYKGKPLAFGSVMLQPVEGGQPSNAVIQSDGTFVMSIRDVGEGATIGLNRVRVTCFPAQNTKKTGNASQELALGKSLIPTKYNSFGSSGLSVEVKPENNEPYVIELDNK